jgi:hypothetical protein
MTPKVMLIKVLEMGVCFLSGPAFGEHGGGSPFLGLLREGKHFFFEGNFYEESERYVKKRPYILAALSIGAPVGETEGGSFTGTFERESKGISGFLLLGPRGH